MLDTMIFLLKRPRGDRIVRKLGIMVSTTSKIAQPMNPPMRQTKAIENHLKHRNDHTKAVHS